MFGEVKNQIQETLTEIEASGLFKRERPLDGAQFSQISTNHREVLNFCANNYLGLANDARLVAAAKEGLDTHGFGMASVRFICGTQDTHLQLERALSEYLGEPETILFPSCFDANGAIFEVLLSAEDAVISDELNHASIIDGIRLSKAQRFRYRNREMADLEEQLKASMGARRRLIVTDGVFSMDGYYAPLREICDLAERYSAMVMVDDSHAVGFVGETGAGTPELFGVQDRVDILSGTLGKALGGASGGYISSHKEIVDLLRQRARPYLFSNSVAPAVVAGSLKALEIAKGSSDLRERLRSNAERFRKGMERAGFNLLPGSHPIIPVMFANEQEAVAMATALLDLGIYVAAFSYPVVPMGKARIRVQISAAHTTEQIDRCISAFTSARDGLLG